MKLRRSVRRTLVRTMVVAAAALGVAAAMPAVAGVLPAVPQLAVPEPEMVLRANTDAYALTVRAEGEPTRAVQLICAPTGGNHPSPRKACEQLDAASGEVAAIPPTGGMCTTEYRPVTVTARGAWRGHPRHYQHEFPNLCTAVRDTGGVLFDF
ncbi:MAG: SSI family serine proteinase inhibitor [Micromonosporaceae bacterium]